jgi:hypothetical protein
MKITWQQKLLFVTIAAMVTIGFNLLLSLTGRTQFFLQKLPHQPADYRCRDVDPNSGDRHRCW